MFMQRYWYILFLLCFTVRGFAQKLDSTQALKEIIIRGDRLKDFSSGSKIEKFDSTTIANYRSSNLSDLLSQQSSVFVKSYGSGSLATTSFRGAGAEQTAVLWNGFNINSPMYGQTDFALIPLSLNDNISIQYGGGSALWGSGAIAGTIHLNNEPKFDKGVSFNIGSSVGSFSDYLENGYLQISKKNWVSTLKFYYHTAENDFLINNVYLSGSDKSYNQKNASLKQDGIINENLFRINERQKLSLNIWLQDGIRNIPPTLLSAESKSSQLDQTIRLTSQWQYTGAHATYFARAAFFNEVVNFKDEIANYISLNRSQTYIAEIESRFDLVNNVSGNLGINETYTKAWSDGYINSPEQTKTAAFLALKYTSPGQKLVTTASGRAEWLQNNFDVYNTYINNPTATPVTDKKILNGFSPFTYSVGSDYELAKCISFKALVSKVYRTPTFNNLFWNPGGNISLLPESGYSEEIGFKFHTDLFNPKIQFSFEPTWFNRNMDNWILWLPSAYGYWTPSNIMQVWSRGMESKSELKIFVSKLIFRIQAGTNYVVSTNERSKTDGDQSIDKQLIYTPMYSGFGNFSVECKGFYINFNQTYTGYRYTSTDNTEYLSPYWLSNLIFSKTVLLKRHYQVNLRFNINNLFNENYQVILNRAMPMRNYQFTINFTFN